MKMRQASLRAATVALNFRQRLREVMQKTFGGRRNVAKSLGYKPFLDVADYRSRFARNEVANRVVKALPKATWKGGAEIIEDVDPNTETPFEAAWNDLAERLKIWSKFLQADVLSGIGHYAILLIGAPGNLDSPLETATSEDIAYLQAFCEDDALISEYEIDITSPRFGLPKFYMVNRTNMSSPTSINSAVVGRRVHWSRILHMADGLLDDNVFGEPRLKCIWNRLDDLEKVAGGGAEAFWRRADAGTQFDLDPTLDVDEPAKQAMKDQIEGYEHDLQRLLTTRGVTIKQLGSDVADFSNSVNSIISLISAGTGIPQRVLMGSEQAKLASQMDRSNWDERVEDRRKDYAAPHVVRPFIDRMIELGVLPKPVDGYDVIWTLVRVLDDGQRAEIAAKWAALNSAAGETVVLPDEIRQRVLGLVPLDLVRGDYVPPSEQTPEGSPAPTAAQKGEAEWMHILRSADRFSGARPTHRERRLRRRQAIDRATSAAGSGGGSGQAGGPGGNGEGDSGVRKEPEALLSATDHRGTKYLRGRIREASEK